MFPVAAIFGNIVAGAASQVLGNLVSQGIGSLVSQFGQSNVAGALSNTFTNALGDALKTVIDGSPLPQALKDLAKGVIDQVLGSNQQPTTPECQCAVEEAAGDCVKNAAETAACCAGEQADEAAGEGGNWLVALAKALAEVQQKFLDKAMENIDQMESSEGTDSKDFLSNQAEYQANIQMFNMAANMTSTSLKSIGEGLTAIARKQ